MMQSLISLRGFSRVIFLLTFSVLLFPVWVLAQLETGV